jgi:hypothetical protein
MHAMHSVSIPRSVGYRQATVIRWSSGRGGARCDAVEIGAHSIDVGTTEPGGCVIMIMYEVSTSARRSNSTHSLTTGQLSPGCPNRITAGRHKVEQTLINNTVTVKEHHVPLQS